MSADTDPSESGTKPFKTVDTIIIPGVSQGSPPSVTIGTTDRLGLSSPIASVDDVVEWSKLTGGAGNSYVVQDRSNLENKISVEFGTILLPSSPDDASFEFTYLTP